MSSKTQTLLIAKTTIDFFDRADTQSLSDGQGTQYESVLPEFKVVEMLGEGGMGQVFLAQQSAPERGVAVKRLREPTELRRQLLWKEAMITGMLEHPNIVPIYQINHIPPNNDIEIVMKRIEGEELSSIIRIGALSAQRSIEILIQVCNAVEYAHSKGVIHRDIKAENIMVGRYGEIYLMDWGIALMLEEREQLPAVMVGTPTSMAPEMITGEPTKIGPHTDIYLLGALLHECLTGTPLHTVAPLKEMLEQIRLSAPQKYPGFSETLQEILHTACHPIPEKRYSSVKELREELASFLDNRVLYKIIDRADDHFSALRGLISQEVSVEDEKVRRQKVHNQFNQARFGYEQAARSTDLELQFIAEERTIALAKAMCAFLFEEGKLSTARWVIDSLNVECTELRAELEQRLESQHREQKEKSRLVEIGRSFDPVTSLNERLLMGFVFIISMTVFSFFLSQYAGPTADSISTDRLFFEASLTLIPFLTVVIWKREKLWREQHGRRATIGVVGSLMVMFFHRWVALKHNVPSPAVIFTDTFIISLGFANTVPTIPSGLHIAIFCFVLGIITVIFPATFWWTSLLMILYIGASIGLDVYHGWQLKKQNEHS